MKKIIVILILSVLTLICCAHRQVSKKYIGQHIDQVITENGPPKSIAELSNGNKVYLYETNKTAGYGGNAIPTTPGNFYWIPGGMTTKIRQHIFIINQNGIVIETRDKKAD